MKALVHSYSVKEINYMTKDELNDDMVRDLGLLEDIIADLEHVANVVSAGYSVYSEKELVLSAYSKLKQLINTNIAKV